MVINYVDRGFFIQFSKNVNNTLLLPSFGGSSCDPLWYHSKTNPNRLLAFSARFWRYCFTMFVALVVLSCSVFSRQWGIVRAFKITSSVDAKDIENYELQDSLIQDDIVLTTDQVLIHGVPDMQPVKHGGPVILRPQVRRLTGQIFSRNPRQSDSLFLTHHLTMKTNSLNPRNAIIILIRKLTVCAVRDS